MRRPNPTLPLRPRSRVLHASLASLVAVALLAPASPAGAQGLQPAVPRAADRSLAPTVPLGYAEVDQALTFDDPSFAKLANGAAHAQDIVVSHAGWQFLVYWDADRYLALARRRLPRGLQPAGPWSKIRFDDYQILGQDAHNTANVGICPADGTIHLAFDHHGDPLNYRVSVPGLADDPTGDAWSSDSFGPVVDTLDPAEGPLTSVTYPRFVPTPAGDLQMFYRQFSSGNGRMRMVDYSAATGTWSDDRVIIERTGSHTDPLGGSSNSRNPYFNRVAYDDQGTLHATWTWREKAPVVYNRDIAYAYSEDGGGVWFNGAHVQVADSLAGQPIFASSPGINAVTLGAEWGLMNDQGHAVDGRGRVHVVMYYKDQPDTVVSYGSQANSSYRHHWLDADGLWRSSTLGTIGNRPKLLVGERGNLLLAYQRAGDLVLERATPEADYLDWGEVHRTEAFFGSSAQADHGLHDATGSLTVAMQDNTTTPGTPTALGVVDVKLATPAACGVVDRRCTFSTAIPTEQDTYVRGGSFAATNFGTAATLEVQADADEGETRLGLLRFHLVDLADRGAITRATLRVAIAAAGPGWSPGDLQLRRCAQDAWGETTTTWDNRPLPSGAVFPGTGGGAFVDVDVTSLIATELANGGSRITFELSTAVPSPTAWVDLHAREAGPGLAATLLVDQANTLEPVADTYVRSGAYAADNYGADDRLIVKEDPNLDYDREAFLRFDVSALAGTGTLDRVLLEVHAPVLGPLGATTPFGAYAVADDTWLESTMTWNDRPPLGAALSSHFGRTSMRWDVTQEALAALATDGLLSLGLKSQREGSPRIAHLASREETDSAQRPVLLVRYAP